MEDSYLAAEKLAHIRYAVQTGQFRLSSHADEEAIAEGITMAQVKEALLTGRILEDYPEHRRGLCCLVYGRASDGRDLHVVITRGLPPLTIVTVYEPKPPHWPTPVQRGA